MRLKAAGTLLVLGVLFLLPLVAAWSVALHPQWLPAAHTNNGTLISPPVATPFKGQWTLVVPEDGACGIECRRVRWVARVARYALAPEARALTETANCGSEARVACRTVFQRLGNPPLIVVDPAGNAMLRYDAEVSPRELLQDLQRLLKVAGYWRGDAR